MSTGKWGYAFFGSLDGATVRNLTLGDPDTDITWTFTGDAPKATSVASLAVYAVNSTIESCTNYYNIDFAGDSGSEVLCVASGLVGVMKNSTIGGRAKSLGCANYGFVRTGKITNNGNGGNGMQTAGICGFMAKDEGNLIQFCVNYGHISCPTGRTGGLVATLMNGNVKNSDNRGTVEDDIVGKFEGAAAQNSYNSKRMGGLIGGTDDLKKVLTATVESCTNYGNVFTHIGCRTGGFIGHPTSGSSAARIRAPFWATSTIPTTVRHGPADIRASRAASGSTSAAVRWADTWAATPPTRTIRLRRLPRPFTMRSRTRTTSTTIRR